MLNPAINKPPKYTDRLVPEPSAPETDSFSLPTLGQQPPNHDIIINFGGFNNGQPGAVQNKSSGLGQHICRFGLSGFFAGSGALLIWGLNSIDMDDTAQISTFSAGAIGLVLAGIMLLSGIWGCAR